MLDTMPTALSILTRPFHTPAETTPADSVPRGLGLKNRVFPAYSAEKYPCFTLPTDVK